MANKITEDALRHYRDAKILIIGVCELKKYEKNSRTHSDAQIDQIVNSIKEFGFTNPILIDENEIIAGHGRLMAAIKMGMDEVPCISLFGLSEVQKRAYIIADNQLAMNAGWDDNLLSSELIGLQEDGFDLDLLGFDNLDTLILVEPEEGLTDEDAVPEPPEEPVTRLGDIWVLGNHRLMCGDSTSIDAVERLMDGNKADMVFTDPPYNVSFNGRSGKFDVIKNDNLSEKDFDAFIEDVCQTIKALDVRAIYVWCNWEFYSALQDRLPYRACIVWAKNVFGMGSGYRHQHEFCLFDGKIDEEIKNESDLWQVKKDTKYLHPTQKPVELSVRAFGNHIKLLNVLDLFGGSGSTVIGAEQTGRKCHVMELDPIYCDVIIKRWQDYTGKDAILSSMEFEGDDMELEGLTFKDISDGRK
jgi:DNA modification methylase